MKRVTVGARVPIDVREMIRAEAKRLNITPSKFIYNAIMRELLYTKAMHTAEQLEIWDIFMRKMIQKIGENVEKFVEQMIEDKELAKKFLEKLDLNEKIEQWAENEVKKLEKKEKMAEKR